MNWQGEIAHVFWLSADELKRNKQPHRQRFLKKPPRSPHSPGVGLAQLNRKTHVAHQHQPVNERASVGWRPHRWSLLRARTVSFPHGHLHIFQTPISNAFSFFAQEKKRGDMCLGSHAALSSLTVSSPKSTLSLHSEGKEKKSFFFYFNVLGAVDLQFSFLFPS